MCTPSFYSMFYTVIAEIPAGKVLSYGDVAKASGMPRHARWVGKSLAALPARSKIPWHRVLKADGSIAFPIQSAAYLTQEKRLKKEGVVMNQGRYSMQQYRWLQN